MSNRSGSPYSTPRDANRVPFLTAASTADGITPVVLEADPTTHLLQVSSSGGGGGGTQYTDGSSTIAHPIGTIPVYDKAGTITAVSVANPLPVSATVSTAGLATSTIQTDGTQKTQLTDGTNIVNVLKSDGTAAGQNAQLVAGTGLNLTSLTAGSLNADLIASTDVTNYRFGSINVAGTWSGTISVQGSHDNSTFFAVTITGNDGSYTANGTFTTNAIKNFAIYFRYLRIRMTAYVSGTATATAQLNTLAMPMATAGASQVGTWTVGSNSATGSAVPANAFFMGMSDGTNLLGIRTAGSDGASSSSVLASTIMPYNGTTYDRVRSANGASNTTGTGLLGVGNLGYDGTNWQSIGAVAGDAGFNGLATSSATKTYTFTTSGSGAQLVTFSNGQNYIPTAGYAWIELVNATQGVGSVAVSQWSPTSGGTYIGTNNWGYSTNTTSSFGVPLSTNIIGWSAIHGNYFQISFSALTSGTVSGTITLRAMSQPVNGLSITGSVGTASAVVNVGQQTSNTSAVQLSASSTVPTNGIVIEALIANAAVVYIGGSGVTTSTGFQLSPGQSLTLTCNLNTIYVIGSNATDKVCWSVA